MNLKRKRRIMASTLLCTMCAYSMPVFAFTKDETVYAKMNAYGENYQTMVSTHLENDEELELIHDISDLINIENTKGEEEFSQNGNDLVWEADKKDIYYQGESQKDLPIECEVKYELEGKEVKAEEIVGKTGHVKIKIQYTNKDEHIVSINGKKEKMYTPFVAVAGTILQNDNHKNIEISNGKVINDGSKTFVMGIALPGLQQSLNIHRNDLEIPDSIDITMDATEFELGNIVTFVTPKVLEEDDLNFFNQLDEIYNQVNTLETASNQIQEGSTALAEGTNQLASGTKELKEGSNKAYNGAKQIQAEVTKATNQLANGQGGETLDANTLNAIGETAASAINGEDIAKLVNNKIAGVSIPADVAQGIVTSSVTTTLSSLVGNPTYDNLSDDEKALVLSVAQNSATSAVTTTGQMIQQEVSNMGQSITQTIETTVKGMAKEVARTVATQVANKVKEEAQNQVMTQMYTLGEGLNQLTVGLGDLKEGTNSLQNGVDDLNKGANTLAEGIKTFNEEGIKKICDYMNGDLKDVSERVEKLTELSKEYNNFTMLNGDNNGEVKFIMIMDAIKKQETSENSKEQAVLPAQKPEIGEER